MQKPSEIAVFRGQRRLIPTGRRSRSESGSGQLSGEEEEGRTTSFFGLIEPYDVVLLGQGAVSQDGRLGVRK